MNEFERTTTTIYMSKELHAKAKAIAASRKRSFSEYVVTLIERDLREIEKRKSEQEVAA